MKMTLYAGSDLSVSLLLILLCAGSPALHAQDPLAAGGGFADRIMSACRTDARLVNQVSGWATRWPGALEAEAVGSQEERAAALAFWSEIPDALETDIAALREGLRAGTSAPRPVVSRVLAQVDGLLALPPEKSPFWSPARRSPDPEYRRDWSRKAEAEWLPAIRRYREFLGGEYLQATRTSIGLGATPGGVACYERLIEAWTSLPETAEEVEAAGRRTLAALQAELLELAVPEYGETLDEVLGRLRNGPLPDPFETREDVVRHARAAVARAEAAVHEWIGSAGQAPIDVVPMQQFMESSFPAGFYRGIGEDGTAAYVINTSRPAERRLLSEAIAFHEAIPGHHTHGTTSEGAGPFVAGFAEGWAIYAEVLAEEMGLYSSDLDRIGRIAKHLWATSRLIVEPGLHVHGWTREEAIRFMLSNTPLARTEIELEVDRYLALPGQSLSYMMGNLHLRTLRVSAEEELGPLFDIREFHDAVLVPGMRPLSEVSADVGRWVARRTVSAGQDTLRAFAPDVLPTGRIYRGTFSPNGREFYFVRGTSEENEYRIHVSRLLEGRWSLPRRIDLDGEHSDLYPTLSPDGERLVFASYRPFPGATGDDGNANLWIADRMEDGWGAPRPLTEISRPDRYESHPMIEPDGRLSYRRARADWSAEDALVAEPDGNGSWGAAVPDERIERWRGWRDDVHLWGGLAHPSGELVMLDVSPLTPEGGRGRSDLWVTHRTEAGWTEPTPAGGGINTEGWDNFPAFTPDGRQLIFVRDFQRFLTAPLELLTRHSRAEGGLPSPPSAQSDPTPLDAVAFMAGTWCSAPDGRGTVIEEHYTTPSSNLMLGVTRYLRDGATISHEFTRLGLEDGRVVLLAMPSGQTQTPFPLTRAEPGLAVFENPEHDFPVRIVYRRTGDGLAARIEGTDGQGPEWQMTLCHERRVCPTRARNIAAPGAETRTGDGDLVTGPSRGDQTYCQHQATKVERAN